MSVLPPRLALLTIREAANALRVSPKTILRRIGAGEISAVRDGRLLRISVSEIENFIAQRRTT